MTQNKGNILAVDDTEASLKVLSDLLKGVGYSVRSALTGEMALRSAAHQPPDLVLLDIRMPDMDGFEVYRQLRARPETRDIPVIFFSGRTETDDKLRGFELGAVDYFTKPYRRDELLARIATHVNLRRSQLQVTAQNEELRRYRTELEELVAQRTAELQESNRQLALVSFALDHVREAAYLMDGDGRFFYVNQEACRAHGYGAEELCRMDVTAIDPDFSPEMIASATAQILAKGSLTFETRHRRRDGTIFPVEITASAIRFEDRDLSLSLARDISERKEAERRLHESYVQLQELSSRRESDREQERKRIAHELHDELGQHLTALHLGLSTILYRMGNENTWLAERLEALTANAHETIQVVRNVAASLRPPVLDMGIGDALESLAGHFRTTTGLTCNLTLPTPFRPLTEEALIALYRIVQEALTNIARHAQATTVDITIRQDSCCCRLEIMDDGQGFAPSAKCSQSLGILGMQERIEQLDGEFSLSAAPGKGVRIEVRIPASQFADATTEATLCNHVLADLAASVHWGIGGSTDC
jgi:PAS domain S-box-containing protein